MTNIDLTTLDGSIPDLISAWRAYKTTEEYHTNLRDIQDAMTTEDANEIIWTVFLSGWQARGEAVEARGDAAREHWQRLKTAIAVAKGKQHEKP